MAKKSKIEWCDSTWNPMRGCTRVSEGCRFCYAEVMSARYGGVGQPFEGYSESTEAGARWTGKVSVIPHIMDQPIRWTKPRLIFVNSMSDTFHEHITDDEIQAVFDVMHTAHHHTYQVLTKRVQRLCDMSPRLPWADHIWAGVSVENADVEWRIDMLKECDATVKFLSLEPLIGPLPHLNLDGIDWVIVGGESGTNPRPMESEWAIDIRDQCDTAGVPYFFKQHGGSGRDKGGRILDGKMYNGMPKIWINPDPNADGPDMADFAEAHYQ